MNITTLTKEEIEKIPDKVLCELCNKHALLSICCLKREGIKEPELFETDFAKAKLIIERLQEMPESEYMKKNYKGERKPIKEK